MSKSLVTYFSASGSTRKLAQRLAKVAAAYLDWTEHNSRSTRERDLCRGRRPERRL